MQKNRPCLSQLSPHANLAITIAVLFVITISSCDMIQELLITEDVPEASETTTVTILGGTPGGSFTPFAHAVSNIATQNQSKLEIAVEASPGSVANTRRVNENQDYLGIAFSSESYLGFHGQEVFAEEGAKTNIRAVTLLYIAYSQTAVLADSDIHQFEDLVGNTIASGRIGSGSAQTIARLATSAGIWGEFMVVHKGSDEGATALRTGEVNAFHMLVSVPNDAMAQLAATNDIRMLDMDAPAQASGFYDQYPFYLSGALPVDAYGDKVETVNTLLIPTLLIAHKDMSAEIVYAILQRVYTSEGLQAMRDATGGAAADMTPENAPKAFVIPLHQGAYQFWSEQGHTIPAHAMPMD